MRLESFMIFWYSQLNARRAELNILFIRYKIQIQVNVSILKICVFTAREKETEKKNSSWQNKNKANKIYAPEWITFDDLLAIEFKSSAQSMECTEETTIKASRLDFMAIYCCYHTLSLLFYDNN